MGVFPLVLPSTSSKHCPPSFFFIPTFESLHNFRPSDYLKMFTRTLALALSALSVVSGAAVCTPERRIAGGQGVIFAYAQTAPGATLAAFRDIPFGIGSLEGKCITTILADGLPGAPVGFTGNDVVNFGVATRQAFSKVTGFFTDFPKNNSMVINNANIVSSPHPNFCLSTPISVIL